MLTNSPFGGTPISGIGGLNHDAVCLPWELFVGSLQVTNSTTQHQPPLCYYQIFDTPWFSLARNLWGILLSTRWATRSLDVPLHFANVPYSVNNR